MISSGPRDITDGTIAFREITPQDSEMLYRWRFLHSPTRAMFRTTAVVSPEEHRKMIDRYFDPQNTDRWFIIQQEDIPVGTICLVQMSSDGKECESGRMIIDPQRRGENLGSRTLALLLEYCRALGLRRVRSEILEQNEISLRTFRKLGYRETGSYQENGRRFLQFVLDLDEPQ